MTVKKEGNALGEVIKRGYYSIFYEVWPLWLGGILIGTTSIITFAWARPWGVAGGLRNWGDWFLTLIGVYDKAPMSPLLSSNSILDLGLLWGAFIAAIMAKEFVLRLAPPPELFKAFVGGILMGIGATLAGGCNVGGFYTSISAMSMSGIAMTVGLVVGTYIGLKYVYWEAKILPGWKSQPIEEAVIDEDKWFHGGSLIGLVMIGLALIAAWQYNENAYTRTGGLLLCGMAFGFFIQRSRFGFVRAFRDIIKNGEGQAARAIIISIAISMLGFTLIKFIGLRGEEAYVSQAFGLGGLAGGLIFGFGMVIAEGCGSGSLRHAGEGHIKFMVAVFGFSLASSLFRRWLRSSDELMSYMGSRTYLPDIVSYKSALTIMLLGMLVVYVIIAWNEITRKFVVKAPK